MWSKKQKIRWEKVEKLIQPNVLQRFSQQCQNQQTFVSTEQATFLIKLTSREIFRLVEIDAVNFFETEVRFFVYL